MDKKFKEDRKQALADIHDALLQKMEVLAKEGARFSKADDMSMPEIIELEQKFRWLPTASGSRPLRSLSLICRSAAARTGTHSAIGLFSQLARCAPTEITRWPPEATQSDITWLSASVIS